MMAHCKVSGCMANTDSNYSGTPACMQGFGGTPELAAATFKNCLLRGTDQLLPDVLDGMSMSTGAGITDAEMREILDRAIDGSHPTAHATKHEWHVEVALAAMRAVEARTRQATPAADAMAEAIVTLRAEFTKPQFMTMSSGNGKSSVEFTFHGEDRFKRACDLHNAFIALAAAFIARHGHTGEK